MQREDKRQSIVADINSLSFDKNILRLRH